MEEQFNPAAMWDERFAHAEPVYGDQPNVYLREQVLGLAPGCSVLLPGDGYGRNGLWLASQGFRVHTVDISAIGVERARSSARAAGLSLTIERADLSRWAWPENQFDAVASIFVHFFPDLRAGIHARMLRALVPGGRVHFGSVYAGATKIFLRWPKTNRTSIHDGATSPGFCRR